jgi:hypothetical protein
MLTNVDLKKLAKEMKINLIAVCSKDELQSIKPKIGGYIVNMQNSQDGNGTHWVSFILYENDKYIHSLYFDSYGMPPPIEIKEYINKINDFKIPYNTKQIQKIQTSECGWYDLSFIYNMQYKRKSNDMVGDYEKYLKKYSHNLTKDLQNLKSSFKPYEVNFYKKIITKNVYR